MVDAIREILRDVLQLGDRADSLDASSPLFGIVPELDSMAIVTVMTVIEEEFGIEVEDEEISMDTFLTVGALAAFVTQKVAD